MSKYPWTKTFNRILSRCNNKNQPYYKKGIKNFLTIKDLKFLWFRDRAYLMKQPSIHRRNSNRNYTLKNCKYVELIENLKEGGLKSGGRPKTKVKIVCLNCGIEYKKYLCEIKRRKRHFCSPKCWYNWKRR